MSRKQWKVKLDLKSRVGWDDTEVEMAYALYVENLGLISK